jgi:putative protein kinase ArgK-like GTPase of G3E family
MQEYLPNKTLVLNGKPVKCSDAVEALQQQLTLQAQTATSHETWQKDVAAMQAQYTTDVKDLFPEIQKYVGAMYGVGSAEYLAMGFAVPKKRQVSAVAKAHAVLQSQATREARGTMGKKQRLAIKGVVSPVTAVPDATSPSAPSTTSTTTASTSSPNGANGQSH